MTPPFDYSATVTLLQILARGSLRQNLAKAVRLWIILRSLYGLDNDPVYLNLSEKFSYKNWRDSFFIVPNRDDQLNPEIEQSKEHIDRDKIPSLHHKDCRCAITLTDWLFNPELSPPDIFQLTEKDWKESFFKVYRMSEKELNTLLSSGRMPESSKTSRNNDEKKNKRQPFPEGRLFAVTGKNLQQNDFEALIELGWLEWQKNDKGEDVYGKVKEFPLLFMEGFGRNEGLSKLALTGLITERNMTDILDGYLEPINNTQRFFVHLDYVVSRENLEEVEEKTEQLKTIWAKNPVPPLKITYQSASNWLKKEEHIIYPVCIHYYQRAAYLCAFGQTPKSREIDWYNYGLDKLKKLTELDWNDSGIPPVLREKHLNNKIPSPEYIQEQMKLAWGFDFYRESAVMLLRFEPNFHEAYIQNSFRHHTFEQLKSTEEVKKLINQSVKDSKQKAMLMKIVEDYPEDAYYKANYRINDNNIIMRLRAWGPNVEVFLPLELRDRMANDLRQSWELYR